MVKEMRAVMGYMVVPFANTRVEAVALDTKALLSLQSSVASGGSRLL
jgi:hypothetical protein